MTAPENERLAKIEQKLDDFLIYEDARWTKVEKYVEAGYKCREKHRATATKTEIALWLIGIIIVGIVGISVKIIAGN